IASQRVAIPRRAELESELRGRRAQVPGLASHGAELPLAARVAAPARRAARGTPLQSDPLLEHFVAQLESPHRRTRQQSISALVVAEVPLRDVLVAGVGAAVGGHRAGGDHRSVEQARAPRLVPRAGPLSFRAGAELVVV